MSLATVALIGRPNVGKSTLYNALTKTKDALVFDLPGTTRDRQYGLVNYEDKEFIVVDTGGIVGEAENEMEVLTSEQSWQALQSADVVMFVVDAQFGLHPLDLELAKKIRQLNVPRILVINKIDHVNPDEVLDQFYRLGMDLFTVSALQNKGVNKLIENLLVFIEQNVPHVTFATEQFEDNNSIDVAIVGQPNVGKSTLINKLVGENRVVVSDEVGTTRDCVKIEIEIKNTKFNLLDTAGVKRKSKTEEGIEKFAILKSLQAATNANVVLFLIDASRGVLAQDLSLLDFVVQTGTSLVIFVNKWDLMDQNAQTEFKTQLKYKLSFASFAKVLYGSALKGAGTRNIWAALKEAYDHAMADIPTAKLTGLLADLVRQQQPPIVSGRRIKLRYAHSGGKNPQRIVIHGNQTEHVPVSYIRYLSKGFITALGLHGTPLKLVFKSGTNPYAHLRNELSERQIKKRRRAKKIFKK